MYNDEILGELKLSTDPLSRLELSENIGVDEDALVTSLKELIHEGFIDKEGFKYHYVCSVDCQTSNSARERIQSEKDTSVQLDVGVPLDTNYNEELYDTEETPLVANNKAETINDIKMEMVLISPKIAEDLLLSNKGNRPVKNYLVSAYANTMLEGNWKLNGESISIGKSGNILNGQHRLRAIIKSGVSILMLYSKMLRIVHSHHSIKAV